MKIDELKELQGKIIKKNKKINIVSSIVISVFIGITVFITYMNNIHISIILAAFFSEIIVAVVIMIIIKGRANGSDIQIFNQEFKKTFVLKNLEKNFENIVYKPEKGFDESEIKSVGMLDTGDRFRSNDYISGKYKCINFEQSDIHIEEKHEVEDKDGNKKEVWKTIFRGRWMIFDFNKKFKSNIQVISIGFPAHTFKYGINLKKVKMEDIDFNDKFLVFSETEHDAFYILTPHFMEKIKNIYSELKCSLMLGFLDNKLYIAINNNKDSFEYNVFKKIDEEKIEEDILNDIKIITNFVNELDLDNNLFRKEA